MKDTGNYSNNTEAVRKRKYREENKMKRQQARERQRECRFRQKEEIKRKHDFKLSNMKRQEKFRKKQANQNSQEAAKSSQENYVFCHRSTQSRAVQKLRASLPKSPKKRLAVMKSYLKNQKSPTAKTLCVKSKSAEKLSNAVLKDLKEAVRSCKSKRSKDALTAMNIITASISGEHVSRAKCMKRLSDELELPTKRITGGKRIRTSILKSNKSCWTFMLRKTRQDCTPQWMKLKCYNFWMSAGISRPTGNKKDVKRQRLGPKMYSSHMIHILEKSQTEVYQQFRKEFPSITISQRQFEKFKPYFVRGVREQDRMTCCCRQHVEIALLFKSCQDFRRKTRELGDFESLHTAVDATICQDKNPECIRRECQSCGVEKLSLYPEELDTSGSAISWEKYEYVKITTNKGGSKSKIMLVKQTSNPAEMFNYFKQLLESYPAHQLRASWQQTQFKSLVESLPQGECVCVHDFSENYRCGDKKELHATYFQKIEVTIHVTLLYRHAVLEHDGIDSTPNEPEIIMDTLLAISPDQLHDNVFVKEVQQRVAEHLKNINYGPVNTMHEFTDGCAAQYRSRFCFDDLRTACGRLGYDQLIRNYFETSHAKGPQDAAGGFLKRQADFYVLRNGKIQNAQDLYEFGNKNLKENKSSAQKKRIFWFIPELERADNRTASPVNGIRSIRQVKADTEETLSYRMLSCYTCESCFEGNGQCDNTNYTGPYKQVIHNVNVPVEDNEAYIEEETNLIATGMVIAVVADDPILEYYLLQVSKPPYVLRKNAEDSWGASFAKGSSVICGTYFDVLDGNPLHLKKLQRRPAMVYTRAYLYTCAEISAKNTELDISEEVHMNILARLQEMII